MTIGDFFEEFNNRLLNTIGYLFQSHKRLLYICSWVNLQKGKVINRNFGDELNLFLLNEITTYNIRFYNRFFHLPHKNYLVIGSIIENFSHNNSIIWGSGALYGTHGSIKKKPMAVTAVRGKLTRDFLLKEGIDCPEVYGDPALLCPYVYKPNIVKKWKIGLIPHIYDLRIYIINSILNIEGIHLIRFDNYTEWKNVIDEILSCEVILSSSLHGLILSDAYKVPNLWISFSDEIKGGCFKYHDYYSSVNKSFKKPYLINNSSSIDCAYNTVLSTYKEISFNPQPLINACPFDIDKSLFEQ